MSRHTVKLPDLGEGVTQSEIAAWRVAVGDLVKEDEPIVVMLTEKAAVELPSPVAGKVVELCGKAGDVCAVGGALLVIDVGVGYEAATPPRGSPTTDFQPHKVGSSQSTAEATSPSEEAQASYSRPSASPSVRRRARELGIDLAKVRGTGRSGRVMHEDLKQATSTPSIPSSTVSNRSAEEGALEFEEIKIIGLRRKIAEAMQRSKQRIPHFSYVEEVDVTELEALRLHLNEDIRDRTRLTLLPFLMRALVRTVPSFPSVNARFDDEAGVVHRYRPLHIGIATQTSNGLVVPVIRHAEKLDLWASAAEVSRLAAAARDGKARREELAGSTITITSLGRLGGISTTPVINAPETAIIGVNKIVERPVIRNGAIVPRQIMNLSSSFDHRIVDGWDAAQFIQRIKVLLECPATLFMT